MDFTKEIEESRKLLADIFPDADTVIWVEPEGKAIFHVWLRADFGDPDPLLIKLTFWVAHLKAMPEKKVSPYVKHWLVEGIKEMIQRTGRTITP